MLAKTPFALSAAVLVTTAAVSPSSAQWNWGAGAGIGGTRAQLQSEIDQAYKSGRITEAESAPLQTRLNEITNLEAQYRATGGRLSPRERADLEQKLDGLAGAIRRELRDNGYGNGRGNCKHRR